ncbi:DUF192 domain-containing protein [Pseudoroseicyclus tamaricis]|uniref:DUF192 domain-containing protein n=2 Tax=Pseudoroseicyclus tamaricis TaxID=2705421 RepID=A0A6B2JQK4_9RHOB|nr:DUF192 domain-containing protein [Pseudoroseicyclus tamaricis]NDV00967.1 DUF192 domain-containing protein [Pseudoroseicyclus tamaricis]
MLAGAAQAVTCAEDRVIVSGDWGQAAFRAEIADEPAERSQGLMNVPQMGTMEGMLFVYPEPTHATFWMRNTLIPLDMLFFDETGTLTALHENAVPMDETTIDGGQGVQYVLEINGGMARRLGIEEGDLMAHPALGEDAALACE